MHILKAKEVFLVFVALSLTPLFLTLSPVRAQAAVVSVNPSYVYVPNAGQQFIVDVSIADITDLTGYEIKIWYSRSVINATSAVRPAGHFLEPSNPSNGFVAKWSINNSFNATHGQIWASYTLLSPETARTGSGNLFRITFLSLSSGSTPIILNDYPGVSGPVKLADSNANPITHTTTDGLVVVSATPPSPVVSVNPSSLQVSVGQQFTVDVNITGVTNMYAYEIKIWYLSAIVNTTAGNVVRPTGHFLEPIVDPGNYFQAAWSVNNAFNATYGRIYASLTLLSPETARSGNGILFRINFTGVAVGSSPIVLADYPGSAGPVMLADNTGSPIAHTATNGYVTVSSTTPPSPVVSVNPSSLQVPNVGQLFTVDVNIASVTNLYAYEIKVWYDRSVLNATSAVRPAGHFLEPSNPSNGFVAKWSINNSFNATHGQIWASYTLLSPETARTGSGILFRITFLSLSFNSTPITLANYPGSSGPVKVIDNTASAIAHTVINGYVTVLSTTPKTTNNYDGLWHTVDFTINLVRSTGTETYYRLNGGPTKTVSIDGLPQITTEGSNNTLEYWSINGDIEESPHNFLMNIKLDKTAPIGAITINNGALFTNTRDVSLTIWANDSTSRIWRMYLSNTRPAVDLTGNFSLVSFMDGQLYSRSWTLPNVWDGNVTVYVYFVDGAGLCSNVYDATIFSDPYSPHGYATINNGADYTTSNSVEINLEIFDGNGSGLDSMRFYNVDGGGGWSEWEEFTSSKTWLLASGYGPKNVYIQVRDKAGNMWETYAGPISVYPVQPLHAVILTVGTLMGGSLAGIRYRRWKKLGRRLLQKGEEKLEKGELLEATQSFAKASQVNARRKSDLANSSITKYCTSAKSVLCQAILTDDKQLTQEIVNLHNSLMKEGLPDIAVQAIPLSEISKWLEKADSGEIESIIDFIAKDNEIFTSVRNACENLDEVDVKTIADQLGYAVGATRLLLIQGTKNHSVDGYITEDGMKLLSKNHVRKLLKNRIIA